MRTLLVEERFHVVLSGGLLIGLELVADKLTRAPSSPEAEPKQLRDRSQ
jgi:hypothetical protein